MRYEIMAYEFKDGSEEPDTYVVVIDGKDGPLFATREEAELFVAKACAKDSAESA